MAVSQGAAGAQSSAIANWMVDAVVQWFGENQNLEPHEVTEFLEQIFNQEFNCIVEDGSSDEIGTMICDFYDFSKTKSNDEIIAKLQSLPKCDLSQCRVENEDNDEEQRQNQIQVENAMNSMDVDDSEATKQPETDPDGWTTVVTRKKK